MARTAKVAAVKVKPVTLAQPKQSYGYEDECSQCQMGTSMVMLLSNRLKVYCQRDSKLLKGV